MAFHLHERFQTHCQKCFKVFEGDTIREAIALVQEHEKVCWDMPEPVMQKTIPAEGMNR